MTKTEKKQIIDENRRRLAEINAPYDPLTGQGSTSTPRTRVHIPQCPTPDLWLPDAFARTPFVQKLAEIGFDRFILESTGREPTPKAADDLFMAFCRERIRYDVEFWFFACCPIEDKETHVEIQFRLNRAQRRYLACLEKLRLQNKPIDIILVKARQWGGSTMTILYALWIMIVHKVNWNAVICGHVEGQSQIVTGMLQKVIDRYPSWASDGIRPKTSPYQRSQYTRVILPYGSRYSVGSAQRPEKLRSENISIAHLTEVGVWQETKGKKPEDLVQAIFGSILGTPYSMKIIESTAKGVGNYFHKTWIDAVAHKNNFTPVFIPWFCIDIYSKEISEQESDDLLETFTDHDRFLWNEGATLQAIAWYRQTARQFVNDPWRMCTEYPTTANDAFQTSGTCVFRKAYVQNARATCCDPVAYGNFAGRETRGPGALEDIRFHPISDFSRQTASRCCKIWHMPVVDNYRDRYVVAVDTGAGTSDAADFSYVKVFDRLPMVTGGVPEVACTWHGRVDPDYIPWIAVTIAEAYNHALLVIESNKLESSDNTEYLLEEIAEVYDNLYSRTSPEQIRQGAPRKWGFHTNTSTKPLIITDLNAALRDGLYIERDIDTCDELDQYEYKDLEKKVMGAVDGCHDDRVMATAIGNRVCYKWPLPSAMQSRRYRRPRIVSEASI